MMMINTNKLATLVEGDPKAPFPRCREGRYPFPWIALLYPYLILLSVMQVGIKYHFWVFGMTRPEIEPRSSGSLANTLTIMPISGINTNSTHKLKKKHDSDEIQRWYKVIGQNLFDIYNALSNWESFLILNK